MRFKGAGLLFSVHLIFDLSNAFGSDCDESYEKCFRVSTYLAPYGLAMNDLGDFRPGLQDAIDAAAKDADPRRKVVLLGPGKYRLSSCDANTRSHLSVLGLSERITLRGLDKDKTTLSFGVFSCNGIFIGAGARDTIIEDMRLDYERVPFTQGVIRTVGFDPVKKVPFLDVVFSKNTNPFPLPDQAGLFIGAGKADAVWSFVAERNSFYTFRVITPRIGPTGSPSQFPLKVLSSTSSSIIYRIYENDFSQYHSDFNYFKKLTGVAPGRQYVQVGRYFASPLNIKGANGVLVKNVTVLTSPQGQSDLS